jgi:hypothetical protein
VLGFIERVLTEDASSSPITGHGIISSLVVRGLMVFDDDELGHPVVVRARRYELAAAGSRTS